MKLRDLFDHDGDGHITMTEVCDRARKEAQSPFSPTTFVFLLRTTYLQFRNGFKKLALEQPALVASIPAVDTSLNTWLDEVSWSVSVQHFARLKIIPWFSAIFVLPAHLLHILD